MPEAFGFTVLCCVLIIDAVLILLEVFVANAIRKILGYLRQELERKKLIRCERCQHYQNGYCKLLKIKMDEHDFCSYGKER